MILFSSIVWYAVSSASSVLASEYLPFQKPVERYAWRMAGADYCDFAISGMALNASLTRELENKLRSLGASTLDMAHYQIIYYLNYVEHLDQGLKDNLRDGGKFCRQIESEVPSARLHAGEEFRRLVDDYAR